MYLSVTVVAVGLFLVCLIILPADLLSLTCLEYRGAVHVPAGLGLTLKISDAITKFTGKKSINADFLKTETLEWHYLHVLIPISVVFLIGKVLNVNFQISLKIISY